MPQDETTAGGEEAPPPPPPPKATTAGAAMFYGPGLNAHSIITAAAVTYFASKVMWAGLRGLQRKMQRKNIGSKSNKATESSVYNVGDALDEEEERSAIGFDEIDGNLATAAIKN